MKIQKKEGFDRDFTYQWNADWKEEDTDKPILKITKSSVGQFDWCPKKYEFGYIDRKPQDTSEAMHNGTLVHNALEEFYNVFDIKKAETMDNKEVTEYMFSLFPIDNMSEMYETLSINEAQRFMIAKEDKTLEEFLPVINEVTLDAQITIHRADYPKFPLKRDYVIHLQGIIDRMFVDKNGYIPMELKTGAWKEYKKTMMRKEMAYYKLIFDNCPIEQLEAIGLNREKQITHWGWRYPASNLIYVEEQKKSSHKALMRSIVKLLKAYEDKSFPTKYNARTCSYCSYLDICDGGADEGWL